MTHTPGPWQVTREDCIVAAETHVVCFGHDYDDYGGIRARATAEDAAAYRAEDAEARVAYMAEVAANARLIAAAPELLNELRVTARRLEFWIRHAGSTREFAEAATEQTWKLIRRIEEGPS